MRRVNFLTFLNNLSKQNKTILLGYSVIALSYSLVVLSSPMPASIGWVECLMGVGLSVGTIILIWQIHLERATTLKYNILLLFLFCYLLVVPLVIGLSNYHTQKNIIRDIVPLFFLTIIPAVTLLSAAPLLQKLFIRLTLLTILLVGVVTAIQFLSGTMKLYGSLSNLQDSTSAYYESLTSEVSTSEVSTSEVSTSEVSTSSVASPNRAISEKSMKEVQQMKLFLKIYDPAVIFSAIFLLCFGTQEMIRDNGRRIVAIIATGLGLSCAYCYLLMGLRAYVALIILMPLIFWAFNVLSDKKIIKKMIILFIFAIIISYPFIAKTIHLLFLKQLAVGNNGKLAEWQTILHTISSSPLSFVSGIGWGGVFNNPILLMQPSRFSHSLLSFYLLKTGVLGLAALSLYFYLLIRNRCDIMSIAHTPLRLMIILAGIAAVLIGLIFQPIYKMLSYGIVITLLFLTLSFYNKSEEEPEKS
jgi:hypothetical protein